MQKVIVRDAPGFVDEFEGVALLGNKDWPWVAVGVEDEGGTREVFVVPASCVTWLGEV